MGCGGGDGDDGDDLVQGTIAQLRIVYTSGAQTFDADTWTLRGGVDAASRSRLSDDAGVTSDIALLDGFVSLYTREAGAVATSPAGAAPVAEPFSIAEDLVARGEMGPGGTVDRDGRTLEAFAGSARPFLVGEGEGTVAPADAAVRFLRDRATGQPVELRIPAVRLGAEGVGSAAIPAQRYLVTAYREYPATEESMRVFDISAVYGDGAATTTGPATAP